MEFIYIELYRKNVFYICVAWILGQMWDVWSDLNEWVKKIILSYKKDILQVSRRTEKESFK